MKQIKSKMNFKWIVKSKIQDDIFILDNVYCIWYNEIWVVIFVESKWWIENFDSKWMNFLAHNAYSTNSVKYIHERIIRNRFDWYNNKLRSHCISSESINVLKRKCFQLKCNPFELVVENWIENCTDKKKTCEIFLMPSTRLRIFLHMVNSPKIWRWTNNLVFIKKNSKNFVNLPSISASSLLLMHIVHFFSSQIYNRLIFLLTQMQDVIF